MQRHLIWFSVYPVFVGQEHVQHLDAASIGKSLVTRVGALVVTKHITQAPI